MDTIHLDIVGLFLEPNGVFRNIFFSDYVLIYAFILNIMSHMFYTLARI